jgi:hypothetical protein
MTIVVILGPLQADTKLDGPPNPGPAGGSS